MHILLVEPKYHKVKPRYHIKFPPLGLLKLAAYHRQIGDTVELVEDGPRFAFNYPDLIYISSLFTYAWEPVHKAVTFYRGIFPKSKILVGGIYASLMPEHAKSSGADEIYCGVVDEVEELLPDYSLLGSEHKVSIIFSSRGCVRKCPFCAVPSLEPSFKPRQTIKHLIYPGHQKVILWDNNFLASPYWKEILNELREMDLEIDFNQGLDARLLTSKVAEDLRKVKISDHLRLGYDSAQMRIPVQEAIKYLKDAGFKGRRILVYTLYNYNETPEEFLDRVRDLLEWGVVAYPMRYEPIDMLDREGNPLRKNMYISPLWTQEQLEMVAKARRVIGYGGAFPPYEGLRKKFVNAPDFNEAFRLEPPKQKQILPTPSTGLVGLLKYT